MMHEHDDQVIAIRMRAMVTDEHRLELIVPKSIPPGAVEVLILLPQQGEALTVGARGLDSDVERALRFFRVIQQRATGCQSDSEDRVSIDEGPPEDVRVQY